MKKVLLAIAMVASFGQAFAVALPSGGGTIEAGAGNCVVLGESVRINLSASVTGAYECNESLNAINIAACHASGTRNSSITCQAITDNNGQVTGYNDGACNANNVGQTVTAASPDYRGFRASTTGGSVAAQFLGGACSDGTVGGLVTFN